MSFLPTLLEKDVFTVLNVFLETILPATVEVVKGQDNRVPEPRSNDFVVCTPIGLSRLAYNTTEENDVAFVGSISNGVLTVTQMLNGTIESGMQLTANGLNVALSITSLGTGTGGLGTYNVSDSTVSLASTTIQAGYERNTHPQQFDIQIDVHGPNSFDNAQTIATLWRSEYGIGLFTGSGAVTGNYVVSPLYCDDPKQAPFSDAEQQTENRWIIQAYLQINPSVNISQQYADTLSVGIKELP